MMERKLIFFLTAWLLLLWGIRVVNVNRMAIVDETEIGMQQNFYYNGLSVTPIESHLYTIPSFQKTMEVEVDQNGEDVVIICVKFHIKNETGETLGWEQILDGNMGYGFETITWYSGVNPFLGAKLNRFSSEEFAVNEEADVWLATEVNKACFQKKHWNKLDEYEFYYVMDLYPYPVRVRLDCGEVT